MKKGGGELYAYHTRTKTVGETSTFLYVKNSQQARGKASYKPYVTVHVEIRNYFSPWQGTRQVFLGLPHHHIISTTVTIRKRKDIYKRKSELSLFQTDIRKPGEKY